MLTEVKSAAQAVSGLEYIAQRLKTGQFGTQVAATGKGNSLLGKLSKSKAEGGSAKAGKPLFSFMKKGK